MSKAPSRTSSPLDSPELLYSTTYLTSLSILLKKAKQPTFFHHCLPTAVQGKVRGQFPMPADKNSGVICGSVLPSNPCLLCQRTHQLCLHTLSPIRACLTGCTPLWSPPPWSPSPSFIAPRLRAIASSWLLASSLAAFGLFSKQQLE